jgi:hypothetical protein
MGQLGLPHATNQAAEHLQRGFQSAASMAKDVRVFENLVKAVTKLFTGDWPKLADPRFLTKAITEQSVTTFESALDAATLIFAHSVLDSAALDWCRVCALAEPEDFMPHIDQKKVTLSEVQRAEYSELRETAINGYLDRLEREPLIKKLDLIFSLCPPSPTFVGIEDYRYDRDRIIALDNLRHDYVHRGALSVRLPRGDDDLSFLSLTDAFLLFLVIQRFGIRLWPIFNFLANAVGAISPPQAE